ncbi:glyoxylase I 4 isoform X3 [Beta vulgaris subsp. vulgaris]|uniref:glyoxylase I 4 isoform X3 n=1 Tax=Beta vulgaris subsp. vulgaris TaxID=3555 RepID=UPI0009005B47|nr:glyoxylase I 4 isoform X3 [Beta vulgaris subsp. vulgaris]
MAAAQGVCLNHIARESADVKRLATFYQQILGFEQIESPKFGEFEDPTNLPRGHHISFSVSNFDEFVLFLKDKGIETFEKTQPDGKTKQVFFFDPDGNGLEVGSWGTPSQ